MEFSPEKGVVLVDWCPYDGSLPARVLEDSATQLPTQPSEAVLSILWLDYTRLERGGVAVDAMDKKRLAEFTEAKSRDRAKLMVSNGALKVPGFSLPVPGSNTPLGPTLDATRLKCAMPNSEGHLPLRQDWIENVESKLTITMPKFTEAMATFNKQVNPSGVPFKGRKRAAPEKSDEEANATSIAPEDTTKDALKPDLQVQGGGDGTKHVSHDLMIKDGRLYASALEDGILSVDEPICYLVGAWLTGDDDKEQIAKKRPTSKDWAFKEQGDKMWFTVKAEFDDKRAGCQLATAGDFGLQVKGRLVCSSSCFYVHVELRGHTQG